MENRTRVATRRHRRTRVSSLLDVNLSATTGIRTRLSISSDHPEASLRSRIGKANSGRDLGLSHPRNPAPEPPRVAAVAPTRAADRRFPARYVPPAQHSHLAAARARIPARRLPLRPAPPARRRRLSEAGGALPGRLGIGTACLAAQVFSAAQRRAALRHHSGYGEGHRLAGRPRATAVRRHQVAAHGGLRTAAPAGRRDRDRSSGTHRRAGTAQAGDQLRKSAASARGSST